MGESDAALKGLIERYADDSACQIAQVHGARGEMGQAFEWLERAYVQHDGGLTGSKTDPRLRSLREDPRWSALMKKMGLDD